MRRGAFAVVAFALGVLPTLSACASSGGTPARPASVTVLTQNLLHGTACAPDTDRCDLPARVALFARQLEAERCPALVSVQEANARTVAELRSVLPTTCQGAYRVVWDDDPASDREVVLTTLPVLGSERVRLAGPLRTALWVRVRAPVGSVDLVTTHLASGSDDRRCDAATCPAPCRSADSLNTCQARQAADLLDERRGPRSVGILAGDLNAKPGEPTIAVLGARGYVDTVVAAGTEVCKAAERQGCTSGRVDTSLVDLANAQSRQTERIDYLFLSTTRGCTVTRAGVARPTGGPTAADGLVFPSDHSAVAATLRCPTTAADRAAATRLTRASTTTTTGAAVSAETRAAVQAAFDTLFSDREPDPERRLRALEDGDAFRESFLARLQSLGALRTQARIDSFTTDGPDAVAVVYSILLDGNVVLDALPGRAVHVGDTWVVSKATYCQVAGLGATTVPEPCR
jgi:endonuclease/exonuclease/phosphatase family metal-dependent hydrolase